MTAAPAVIPAAVPGSLDAPTGNPAIERDARELAGGHRSLVRADAAARRPPLPSFSRPLERASVHLGKAGDGTLKRASEWFLDNYYLIRRAARQVDADLPRGFDRRLPVLAAGASKGARRVEALARAIVQRNAEIDPLMLRRFVRAYQEVAPLTIAELWALPTMLRAAVLEDLALGLQKLGVPIDAPAPPAEGPKTAPSETTVERAVRALRAFAEVDWKKFFEEASRVEAVLKTDPAGVYSRMNFETRDDYRKVVEELAWGTGKEEGAVAADAVALAAASQGLPRTTHVGYYLVAEGRYVLERAIGYHPRGAERLNRLLRARPTLTYLSLFTMLTLGLVLVEVWYLERHAASWSMLAIAVGIGAVPASASAITLLQWVLARAIPPTALPKLDFSRKVPDTARTLVVIPTLLGSAEDVDEMLRQIERHYLANSAPNLEFALLTDDVDRASATIDATLAERASEGVRELNARHQSAQRRRPFHLLHRQPKWNEAEGRFMGWERKRGKLVELNRLLRGDRETSYSRHEGDPQGLEGIRYVITLDSDTYLPRGSAANLASVLAHPLNTAVFDDATDRVTAGYSIVQPRVETLPASARVTRFSAMAAGDVGFDIYTHACSDLYQDLFGAGIYVGKGIYDVDAFMRSVKGRVPENALASHDLFEGIYGRAALATDIVLFEGYPSHYAAYARRLHRWLRGDWQLLRWLFPRVPTAGGQWVSNPLLAIDRWKIADNLRRSLVPPLCLLLLVLGWTYLPGEAWVWTIAGIVGVLAPSLPTFLSTHRLGTNLARCALAIALLVHEARVSLDAIVRVMIRTFITKKNLLEWTTAAHTARGLHGRSPRAVLWRELAWSPAAAVTCAVLVASTRPAALWVAAPLLLAWLVAPEIARWVSLPLVSPREQLSDAERRKLRLLARRTWSFFETLVGPADQWLPIDNYQEPPQEQFAHRTSPTNIGMLLLSTLAAYDFGYLGLAALCLRVKSTLETVHRLEHYRGHLLNWYDTRSLAPLLPRYVSTVDSGNFEGALVALKVACHALLRAPIVRPREWQALSDCLGILREVLGASATDHLRKGLDQLDAGAQDAAAAPEKASLPVLRRVSDELLPAIVRDVYGLIETGAFRHDPEKLGALRQALESLHLQVQQMRRELDTLLPWAAHADEARALGLELPTTARLDEVDSLASTLRARLDVWAAQRRARGENDADREAWIARLGESLDSAQSAAPQLQADLRALAEKADHEALGIDYRLLYDGERKLFRIGYNVTADRADANYYDLLASEARLASFLAIVKQHVPESHWYALGRPMTGTPPPPGLLSWAGTMFEYLMPCLLMRSNAGTLLDQTYQHVVRAQIDYGKKTGAPWGISESAFARMDGHKTYQYRSFGVPGLGFKRGLDEDHVVAPYACLLAVGVDPKAVIANVERLTSMGMLGLHGMYEALDLGSEAVPEGQPAVIVRSYMAHHQGMALVALDNALHDEVMVERFHADPVVEAGELLLNERAPIAAPSEQPTTTNTAVAAVVEPPAAPNPWTVDPRGAPQVFVLSNGRLSSILSASGGGGIRWEGLALTRYQADPTVDTDGVWLFLRDEEDGTMWPAVSDRGTVTFSLHKAEFHHRNHGISAHVEVTVDAADDVEIRQVTLYNESERPRRLRIASAGEPVMVPIAQVAVHPAFARMFLESELVPGLDGLVFTRRAKSESEEKAVVFHRLVGEAPQVRFAGFETDRGAFFGRNRPRARPLALEGATTPQGKVGDVVDPIMSVTASIELKPNARVVFAFVTGVARTRAAALDLARRHGSIHAVRWAFRDSDQESRRRLHRAKLAPALVAPVQRFLSAMHFADPASRASSSAIADGRPCQRRLWGHGISGDDPIVFVRVHDPEAPIVRELLTAQRFLRSSGVRLDLVLCDEKASGYDKDGSVALRAVLRECEVDEWINRHGGVYVIAADQVKGEERGLLEASAHVVLDTHDGSLGQRFARPSEPPTRLPRLEPTLEANASPARQSAPPLSFDNGLGGFSADGREYVTVVKPGAPLPAPWCNVMANPQFGCLVSESSLGCTWSGNAGENRLTPWRNDAVHDVPSEALYVRDEETSVAWSPTPLPAGQDAETLVAHGAGYTTYRRTSHGLEQELTVVVPPDAPVKIVRLRLKNLAARHRRLTATYYAEWVLGALRERQRPYVVTDVDRGRACLLARCSWNSEFAERVAFVASERPLHGYTADRTEFLGRSGSYARPEALERWGLSARTDAGVDPCAALQVHLELAEGESLETHFVIGEGKDRDEALALVDRYRASAVAEEAVVATREYWERLLGHVQVKTPDPAMDLLLNRWLLYQALSARFFGRTGFYQSSGAFGFRDQLQDVLATLHAAPAIARAHILESAAHQFEEGDVLHWWHPPAGRGVRTRCSDDMAWLPFVTAEYVAWTGDKSVLGAPVPFLRGEPLRDEEHDRYALFETAPQSASLFEHCRRALERAVTEGPHGLPLMKEGDWNDGMNHVGAKGRGESVWLGWFLVATMTRFASLCEVVGEGAQATRWLGRARALRAKIEACSWDGGWYVRAFHDDGSLVGSAKQRECKIDSIAQSWAVLSGGRNANAKTALRAAVDALVREKERLVLLLTPPFDATPHDPGYIRAYPPGIRENGGQYTHAATWLGWAHADLGDGAQADAIFKLLNPILRSTTAEEARRYRIEPYVLAGDIYSSRDGAESSLTGRGGWSWYTGAAGWLWRLGVEAILGLRLVSGRLSIDPCIPPEWKGFEAWVDVDGQRVHVVVDNPASLSRGVAEATLDGAPVTPSGVDLGGARRAGVLRELHVRLGVASPKPIVAAPPPDSRREARR